MNPTPVFNLCNFFIQIETKYLGKNRTNESIDDRMGANVTMLISVYVFYTLFMIKTMGGNPDGDPSVRY